MLVSARCNLWRAGCHQQQPPIQCTQRSKWCATVEFHEGPHACRVHLLIWRTGRRMCFQCHMPGNLELRQSPESQLIYGLCTVSISAKVTLCNEQPHSLQTEATKCQPPHPSQDRTLKPTHSHKQWGYAAWARHCLG